MAHKTTQRSRRAPAARYKATRTPKAHGTAPTPPSLDVAPELAALAGPELSEERLQKRLAELAQLPKRQLAAINVDIVVCVAKSLAAAEHVRALGPALRQALREFDFELAESLEDWALVLQHAHTLLQLQDTTTNPASALLAEAAALRRTLLFDVHALARRELLPHKQLKTLRGTIGFANLAHDLHALHRILSSHAELFHGRSAITEHETRRARALSEELITLVARRDAPSANTAAELRARAFTMLVRAYREARAGVAFLRRNHGDVDRIIPSLFAGRCKPRKARATKATAAGEHDAPSGSAPLMDPPHSLQHSNNNPNQT